MTKKCFLCHSNVSLIDFSHETFKNCSLKLAFRKIKNFKYGEVELPEASIDFVGYHSKCYKRVITLANKYKKEFCFFITGKTGWRDLKKNASEDLAAAKNHVASSTNQIEVPALSSMGQNNLQIIDIKSEVDLENLETYGNEDEPIKSANGPNNHSSLHSPSTPPTVNSYYSPLPVPLPSDDASTDPLSIFCNQKWSSAGCSPNPAAQPEQQTRSNHRKNKTYRKLMKIQKDNNILLKEIALQLARRNDIAEQQTLLANAKRKNRSLCRPAYLFF